MIFDVIQTLSGNKGTYIMKKNDNIIGSAETGNMIIGQPIRCNIAGTSFELRIDIAESVSALVKSPTDGKYYDFNIYSDGKLRGSVFFRLSEGSLMKRYTYCTMVFDNKEYDLFHVGMGKDGMKFPIYRGHNQIALIEKGLVVHNNLDSYKVYTTNDISVYIAGIFSIFVDRMIFSNAGEAPTVSAKVTYLKTLNKELKEKYDAGFKENIEP